MQVPDPLWPLDETNDEMPGSFAPIVTVGGDPPPEQSELDEIETAFDPRYREDFVGLLYLGYLEETCVVAGHRFQLRTPGQEDRLSMGVIQRPYANTVMGEQAWRAVTVAAYLRDIDGTPAPEPLNSSQSAVATRFNWVVNSIHSDQIIELIFIQIRLLDARVREMIGALDNLGEASA